MDSKIGGHKVLTPVVGITLVTQVIPVILLQVLLIVHHLSINLLQQILGIRNAQRHSKDRENLLLDVKGICI